MIDQIVRGCFSGLAGLLLLYAGYALFYLGKRLVSGSGGGAYSDAGMPKWKAATVAAIVAAVLALMAAQAIGRAGSFYLLDQPELGDLDSVTTSARPATERFFKVFVFCCGAMWVGIARSDKH